jgi:uncharacterized protein
MQFNVLDLLRESYGSFREHDIDEDARIDGKTRRITGHVRFDRVPEGVFVRAMLHGVAKAECVRCLDPMTHAVDLSIEETYLPTVDPLTGAHVTPPEGEDDAYRISERHIIDLREAAEQYWSMALPLAPVCRPECEGFCPLCGVRRDAAHACAGDASDDRWSKLRDLKLG